MNQEEIKHLATLARIELSEGEIKTLTEEISAILAYVSVVKDIVGDNTTAEPKVGIRNNVFRQDIISNKPDQYTADVLAQMPQTEGRFMVVKKILNTEA